MALGRKKPNIVHAAGVDSALDAAARAMYEMHSNGLLWSELPEVFRENWRELWRFGATAYHDWTRAHAQNTPAE